MQQNSVEVEGVEGRGSHGLLENPLLHLQKIGRESLEADNFISPLKTIKHSIL